MTPRVDPPPRGGGLQSLSRADTGDCHRWVAAAHHILGESSSSSEHPGEGGKLYTADGWSDEEGDGDDHQSTWDPDTMSMSPRGAGQVHRTGIHQVHGLALRAEASPLL